MQADKAGKRPFKCIFKKKKQKTKNWLFPENYEAPQLKGMHYEILI